MTNIYHIVYFDVDKSIYIFFKGCNFACKGCILKLSPWDCHLPVETQAKLQKLSNIKTLSMTELNAVVGKMEVKEAVLGGGEPTVDEELTYVVKLLKDYNISTVLLTNGYKLDDKMIQKLEKVELNEVCVSIKAFTDNVHIYYTGVSNQKVLENFRYLNYSSIKLRAESVLIPGLIDVGEIELIAKLIASVNATIPYRVDAYTQVPGTPWPSALPEKVYKAVETSKKYLKNVSCIHADMPVVGRVRIVYPEV